MLLRALGFVTITLCGVLMGLEGRRRLAVRVRSLTMFGELLAELRAMIAYNGMALREAAEEWHRRHAENAFAHALSENIAHSSFQQAWSLSLEQLSSELCLCEEEMVFLKETAGRLGRADVESELTLLTEAEQTLQRMQAKAEERLREDGKVYMAVGSSCGMVAALMIL